MRIILFILIIVGTTFIGSSFSRKYFNRLNFFKELNSFINILENQITFKKSTLKNIVLQNLSHFNTSLKIVLSEYFVDKKHYTKVDILNDKENEFLHNFVSSLGKFDVDGEIANLNFYKLEGSKLLETGREEYKKYGTLGTKLGFIAGLLLIIMLI